MKKTILTVFLTIALTVQLGMVPNADAGKKERHLLQGAIIGTGAVILGAAIVNTLNDSHGNSDRYNTSWHHGKNNEHMPYRKGRWKHEKASCDRYPHGGYWRVEKVWVPPTYAKRWNPAHYNKKGYWVAGRYQNVVVKEGYWDKRRIWFSKR